MKKTNTTLARELAEAYAANLPHDKIREELEARGCPRLAIDAAFADRLSPSAVDAMDEQQLDAAIAAAVRDMVEAMKRRAAAASLGRKGGRSRSAAKVAAVRANGAKGGRPPLPTLPIDGYDGNAPEIEFEGFRWAREDYGEYATVVGSRRLYLRATPGAGQTTARLYWIPATPGAEMQILARGLAAVVHTIGHEADKAGVAQVFARDGELDVVWGEQTALHARSAELVDQTVVEFARRGWTVSAAGILHNLEAWSADQKSGYRDDVDGVHLFTPCGCNPFRVTASRLRAEWADWQTTYTA